MVELKKAVRHVTFRAGLSWGILLVFCEVVFGVAAVFLRSSLNDFINGSEQDVSMLMPVAAASIAFLFLLLAMYFGCGMMVAKWLAPLPLRSRDIAAYGAAAAAIAEVLRSLAAVVVNFILSMASPLDSVQSGDVLTVSLTNAGVRLFCGLPAFVVLAAVVSGASAYFFAIIFFRPENAPR